jgi:hypothetical protein
MNTFRLNVFNHSVPFFRKHKFLIFLSFFLFLLLMVLPACQQDSNTVITPTAGGENMNVGFYTEGQTDNNSIVITEAKFILRKMVLKYDEGEDECDLKMGPFVVALDMSGRIITGAIAKVPFGNYDAIKFFVHKPSPNEPVLDPDFYEEHNKRYSVVVKGFYNSVPFVYKSKLTVAKKIDFESHPVAVAAEVIFITVRLNPYSWFFEHGNFLDPQNEHNSHKIDENIKQSLKRAFRDMNQDGEPD